MIDKNPPTKIFENGDARNQCTRRFSMDSANFVCNIQDLFDKSSYYDMIFFTDGGSIIAHKAIMCTASNLINNIIKVSCY